MRTENAFDPARHGWRHRRYQKTAINVRRKLTGHFDEVIHLHNVAETSKPGSENPNKGHTQDVSFVFLGDGRSPLR